MTGQSLCARVEGHVQAAKEEHLVGEGKCEGGGGRQILTGEGCLKLGKSHHMCYRAVPIGTLQSND